MMRYKPMLAYPVSDKPINYDDKIFMQPKLDGVRCLIQYDDGKVTAYSRTGKVWQNIEHITVNLYKFFDKHPNVILDGELYNHDYKDNFEQIISMVRKTKPTVEARAESRDNVQFHCYDMCNEAMPFVDRIKFIYDNLRDSYCVRTVESESVLNDADANSFHKYCLKQGYEGSILRINDVYKCGRSWSLRKFKDFHDTEATITGWVEGKGKRKGTIGKFLAVDADGIEFGMPVMDNFKYLQDNFKLMQGYVGKTATFTYFERTKAGSYRHPLFKCIRDYE